MRCIKGSKELNSRSDILWDWSLSHLWLICLSLIRISLPQSPCGVWASVGRGAVCMCVCAAFCSHRPVLMLSGIRASTGQWSTSYETWEVHSTTHFQGRRNHSVSVCVCVGVLGRVSWVKLAEHVTYSVVYDLEMTGLLYNEWKCDRV